MSEQNERGVIVPERVLRRVVEIMISYELLLINLSTRREIAEKRAAIQRALGEL